MKQRNFLLLLMAATILLMAGCGGGGGSTPAPVLTPTPTATKAIVTVTTTGTLPAGSAIAGIGATVTYPTTKSLTISASDVVVSGAGTGSLLQGNTNTAGQVFVGLINTTGIQAGEFATLTFSFPAGSPLTAADFSASLTAPSGQTPQIIDVNGNRIDALVNPTTGLNVAIKSVSFQ
jgi:hypothetical protein